MNTETQADNGGTAQQTEPAQRETPILDAAIEATLQQGIAKLKFEEDRFGFQQRRARLFARSGMFGGKKDMTEEQAIAQAMVRIELGESMGFSAAESLQGIDVINDRPAISAALRAARMQSAGYSWDIDWFGTDQEPTGVRLWLYLKGRPLLKPRRDENGDYVRDEQGAVVMEHVSVAYRKADAERMLTTIWENNQKKRVSILEKDNWKMSPRNMYFARAISNAQRWYAPGVLNPNLLSWEEAMDLESVAAETERRPADTYRGTREDQDRVAEQKIAELRKETAEEHDARLERQAQEQLEAARARDQQAQEPTTGAPAPDHQTAAAEPATEPAAPRTAAPTEKPSPFAKPKFGFRPAPAKG